MGMAELSPEQAQPGAQPSHLAANSCSGGLGKNSFIRGDEDAVKGERADLLSKVCVCTLVQPYTRFFIGWQFRKLFF